MSARLREPAAYTDACPVCAGLLTIGDNWLGATVEHCARCGHSAVCTGRSPVAEVHAVTTTPQRTRPCDECGAAMTPRGSRRTMPRWCSSACRRVGRQRADRKREAIARTGEPRPCACGCQRIVTGTRQTATGACASRMTAQRINARRAKWNASAPVCARPVCGTKLRFGTRGVYCCEACRSAVMREKGKANRAAQLHAERAA